MVSGNVFAASEAEGDGIPFFPFSFSSLSYYYWPGADFPFSLVHDMCSTAERLAQADRITGLTAYRRGECNNGAGANIV